MNQLQVEIKRSSSESPLTFKLINLPKPSSERKNE